MRSATINLTVTTFNDINNTGSFCVIDAIRPQDVTVDTHQAIQIRNGVICVISRGHIEMTFVVKDSQGNKPYHIVGASFDKGGLNKKGKKSNFDGFDFDGNTLTFSNNYKHGKQRWELYLSIEEYNGTAFGIIDPGIENSDTVSSTPRRRHR